MTRLKSVAVILAVLALVAAMSGPMEVCGEEKQAGQALEPPGTGKPRPGGMATFPRRMGFGVSVDMNLTVNPAAGSGPCPTDFVLTGRIFVNKPTAVQYKFVRSDGKTAEPVTVTFDKPGAVDVTDNFRVPDASSSQSWARIETITPLNVKTRSNTVFFGGTCGAVRTAGTAGERVQRKGAPAADCVSFNPAEVTMRQERNMWKVGDGTHTLFSFDVDKFEAENALAIIRHYHMTQSCFVGSPRPSFHYMLVGDSSPEGPFKGESCRPFDPASIQVRQVKESWTLGDKERTLIGFGDRKGDADQALAIIRQYGFTHFCAMAAGKVDFVYMRK